MNKYAIIDLEMCKVPKRLRSIEYHFANEIIQIGAVLLDENLEIQGEYCSFVHPRFGVIDSFIEELTGISNDDISGAPDLESVLKDFLEWLPENTKVVSWSNSDKFQISKETEAKNISLDRIDEILENWIDCQKTFSKKMHCEKNYNLTEALVVTDISYKDGAHDGLIDAYNTALLFAKIQREPELVLSKYYKSSEEESSCNFSLGGLLSGLDLSSLATA